jgi:hypothetical protein
MAPPDTQRQASAAHVGAALKERRARQNTSTSRRAPLRRHSPPPSIFTDYRPSDVTPTPILRRQMPLFSIFPPLLSFIISHFRHFRRYFADYFSCTHAMPPYAIFTRHAHFAAAAATPCHYFHYFAISPRAR